jgi:hypothetical protein
VFFASRFLVEGVFLCVAANVDSEMVIIEYSLDGHTIVMVEATALFGCIFFICSYYQGVSVQYSVVFIHIECGSQSMLVFNWHVLLLPQGHINIPSLCQLNAISLQILNIRQVVYEIGIILYLPSQGALSIV